MADSQQLTDNAYQRTLTNAESIRVATAEQMTSVDAKLAALEEKIERVTNYRPKRSFGQGNVLQVSVILLTEGGQYLTRHTPPVQAGTPPQDQAGTPPRDQAGTPPGPGRYMPPDQAGTPPQTRQVHPPGPGRYTPPRDQAGTPPQTRQVHPPDQAGTPPRDQAGTPPPEAADPGIRSTIGRYASPGMHSSCYFL